MNLAPGPMKNIFNDAKEHKFAGRLLSSLKKREPHSTRIIKEQDSFLVLSS